MKNEYLIFRHTVSKPKLRSNFGSRGRVHGFTLVEILAVLFVIIATGAVCTDFYREHITSVRRQEALETLTNLNNALDVYRSEFGDFPTGGNDVGHHQNILSLLSSTSYGRQLLESQSVCLAQLESTGSGETFRFTKYKGVDAPAAMLSTEGVADGHASSTWARDNDGIENIPVPTEVMSPLNTGAEARLASNPVHGSVTFDQPGKYEWIVPDGVAQIKIEGIGGGGSGGSALKYQQWGDPVRKTFGMWGKCNRVFSAGYDCRGNYFGGPKELLNNLPIKGPARVTNVTGGKYLTGSYMTWHGDGWFGGVPHHMPSATEEWRTTESRYFLIRCYGWGYGNNPCGAEYNGAFLGYHYIDVQYLEDKNSPGFGGKAGQYQQQSITGLRGGESVFILIGSGENGASGEPVHVSINGIRITCAGGTQGAGGIQGRLIADSNGEVSPNLGLSGNGGQGQAHYNTPIDRKGKNGCVRITY